MIKHRDVGLYLTPTLLLYYIVSALKECEIRFDQVYLYWTIIATLSYTAIAHNV
jgi:hypothetical protein